MSFWQPPLQDRNTTRIAVDVTFLRLAPPAPGVSTETPPDRFPPGVSLVRVEAPSVGFYRYLYNTVGNDYCWWLRRMTPDAELAALLAHPGVGIYVLYAGGEPAGFFELDGRGGLDVNLSYFGLMPGAIGKGLGYRLLLAAIEVARARSSSAGDGDVPACRLRAGADGARGMGHSRGAWAADPGSAACVGSPRADRRDAS